MELEYKQKSVLFSVSKLSVPYDINLYNDHSILVYKNQQGWILNSHSHQDHVATTFFSTVNNIFHIEFLFPPDTPSEYRPVVYLQDESYKQISTLVVAFNQAKGGNSFILEVKQSFSKIRIVMIPQIGQDATVLPNQISVSGEESGVESFSKELNKTQLKGNGLAEQRISNSIKISHFPPPPNVIPESQFNEFTLNGKMNVLYLFCDDRVHDSEILHNSKYTYSIAFHHLENGTFQYYGKEGDALQYALTNYPINGKNVVIWGLSGCNCEAIAVWKGANKVYVVEYNKPICDNEKILVMNHKEIIENNITADFAISYSSFEHDGLGRYGDPLSPDGDFRAMNEAHKYLNKDGILFLGVPLGQDCLVWNAHRIYGKNRLPFLLKGWQLIDVFDNNNKDSLEYPFDLPLGEYVQNVMVLKKIEEDYPDDEYLLNDNIRLGERNKLYKQINKIIYGNQ